MFGLIRKSAHEDALKLAERRAADREEKLNEWWTRDRRERQHRHDHEVRDILRPFVEGIRVEVVRNPRIQTYTAEVEFTGYSLFKARVYQERKALVDMLAIGLAEKLAEQLIMVEGL